MVNISSAPLFGIGASGLKAAQEQIKISSHNIANADTKGFTRSDALYTERAVRAGVDVSVINRYDPQLEAVKNAALRTMAADSIRTPTLNRLQGEAATSGVAESFDGFVNAVYDFRQRGGVADRDSVDFWGKEFASKYNGWRDSVGQLKQELVTQQQSDQTRLTQIQVQLVNMTDGPAKIALTEELATLEGQVEGRGDFITRVIPNLDVTADTMMRQVVDKLNTELGTQPFSIDQTGTLAYDSTQLPRDAMMNNSITGDTVGEMMGAVMSQLGSIQRKQELDAMYNQEQFMRVQTDYNDQTGVDVIDEQLKIEKAKQMYEAMARIIQVEKENLKTLIDIV